MIAGSNIIYVRRSEQILRWLWYLTFERLFGPRVHGIETVVCELLILGREWLAGMHPLGNGLSPAPTVSHMQNFRGENLPLQLHLPALVQPTHYHGRHERAELPAGVQGGNHVLEAARHERLTSEEM